MFYPNIQQPVFYVIEMIYPSFKVSEMIHEQKRLQTATIPPFL